jgi:hypothetical protein
VSDQRTSNNEAFATRFWGKAKEDPETGCLEWQAGRCYDGYGQVRNGTRTLRAHRVAYELACGPIPAGLLVRHKCDNPICVNPEHLEPGTHADNARDASERGRRRVGKGSLSLRLTAADKPNILALHARGVDIRVIAGGYAMSVDAIKNVIYGRTWRRA